MKNALLLLFCCFTLEGCSTFQGSHRALTFTATVVDGASKDYQAEITGLESLESFLYDGPTGLDLSVKNNTNKTMRIVWDKCSLNKKDVFLSRLRYIDLGQQIPPQTIAPGETVARAVYPAENVSPSPMDSWSVAPFKESDLTLLVCLNYANKDHFVIFHVVLAPSRAAP